MLAIHVHVAGHLRKPVIPAGEDGEAGAERQHVVEVRHHVIGVLQHAVDASISQYDAGHAADREQEDEADRPQHRRLELDRAAHIVAIQEKIFTPVGTAITIVAAMK